MIALSTQDINLSFGTDVILKDISFAVNDGVSVYLDESLKRFQTVFPACGSSNSAIELTIAELERYAAAVAWVDVCKAWRAEEQA